MSNATEKLEIRELSGQWLDLGELHRLCELWGIHGPFAKFRINATDFEGRDVVIDSIEFGTPEGEWTDE